MDRTAAQPLVNLSLLRSNSLKFQPLARVCTVLIVNLLYVLSSRDSLTRLQYQGKLLQQDNMYNKTVG
jgi:hypothetical protein